MGVPSQTSQSGVDMNYLKNVILKLFETGQKEALLPVVGMIMQFSPAEMQRCKCVGSVRVMKSTCTRTTQQGGY